MHFVRLAIISVIMLFLVVFALSLFIPSHVRVSRAINIKPDRQKVLDELQIASNWRKWYPGLDSSQIIYKEGVPAGVVIGKKDSTHRVSLMLKGADSATVTAELSGQKMKPVLNTWNLLQNPVTDSLTVNWYMDFHLRWYPWEKFAGLLIEKTYGPKMEQGLTSLKQQVEN